MADSKIKKFAKDHWGKAATGGNLLWWGNDILSALHHMGAFKDGGRVRGVGKAKRGFGSAMKRKR